MLLKAIDTDCRQALLKNEKIESYLENRVDEYSTQNSKP